MKINCAKSSKPLGVRGQGEGGFVFCPDPLLRIQKGSRKKFNDTKTTLAKCQNCEHYRGEHKTMNLDLVYQNPFGNNETIGTKKIILTSEDVAKQKQKDEAWLKEELKNNGTE